MKTVVSAEGKERILRMQGGACWTCRVDFAVLKATRRLSPCFIRPPLENEHQRRAALPMALCQVCVGVIAAATFKSLQEMGEFVEKHDVQLPLTKHPTDWRTLAAAWPVPMPPSSLPQGLRETAGGEVVEIVPPAGDVIKIEETEVRTAEETESWKLVQTLGGGGAAPGAGRG